jgi:hypothetical protein
MIIVIHPPQNVILVVPVKKVIAKLIQIVRSSQKNNYVILNYTNVLHLHAQQDRMNV